MKAFRIVSYIALCIAAVHMAQAQLPQTRGQMFLQEDMNRKDKDLSEIKKGHVPNDKTARLILVNDDMIIGWDAQILSGELTHLQVVEYNTAHPDKPYADVNGTLNLFISFRQELTERDLEFRKQVKWPAQ